MIRKTEAGATVPATQHKKSESKDAASVKDSSAKLASSRLT
jgi:hypothetical protein